MKWFTSFCASIILILLSPVIIIRSMMNMKLWTLAKQLSNTVAVHFLDAPLQTRFREYQEHDASELAIRYLQESYGAMLAIVGSLSEEQKKEALESYHALQKREDDDIEFDDLHITFRATYVTPDELVQKIERVFIGPISIKDSLNLGYKIRHFHNQYTRDYRNAYLKCLNGNSSSLPVGIVIGPVGET